jgi:protein gp37
VSAKTSIEWTDRTWNPVRGCTRVSEGCRNCYAERMASRGFSWAKGFAEATPGGPRWTGKVELIPSALAEPIRWRKPQRIFVNSMSDLFHESLPDGDIARIWGVMGEANVLDRGHTFQILTKRPARMLDYITKQQAAWKRLRLEGPLPNVWLGVSVEDQATADERIPLLLQTPAAVRFVSYEPALAPVDLRAWTLAEHGRRAIGAGAGLSWVIVGGESGPGARRFSVSWARSVARVCHAAGISVFVKQLGANVIDRNDAGFEAENETWAEGPDADKPTNPSAWPTPDGGVEDNIDGFRDDYQGAPVRVRLRDRKGGDMAEWPSDLKIREFPKVHP